MAYGKSIELFLVNGTADSLTIAELSNWNGKAIKIPRIEVSSCYREDIAQAMEITPEQFQMLMQGLSIVAKYPIKELKDPPKTM